MAIANPKPGGAIVLHAFDVDGPLYSRDIDIDFAAYLAKKGKFGKEISRQMVRKAELYSLGRMPYQQFAQEAISLFARGIRSQDAGDIIKEAELFVKSNKRLFHEGGIALVRRLGKQANVRIALVSTSPLVVISAIGKALGLRVDYVYGSAYRSREGKYTGEPITGEIVGYKKNALNALAVKFGVPNSSVLFYGNAVTDFASAKAAGVRFRPMKPSKELAAQWKLHLAAKHVKSREASSKLRAKLSAGKSHLF